MRTFRDRYFENYEKIQTPTNNKRGFKTEYRYKGNFFSWDLDEGGLKKRRALYLVLEAVSLAIFLIAATRRAEFNSLRLVAGLAIASVVPYLAEVWGVLRFAFTKVPLTVSDYNEIKDCINLGSILRFILLAGSILCGLILLIRGGALNGLNLLALIGHILTAAASLLLFRMHSKLGYREYRNQNGTVGPEL